MDKYRFIEKIGRGTHGTVYLLEVLSNPNNSVVCKSILEKYKKQAENELKLLSDINSDRIIKLIDNLHINGSTYLIIEYANHGSLDNLIKFFASSSRKATFYLLWSVLAHMTEALDYLHSNQIIHRDVKPSNILINRVASSKEEILEFKLCDFSLAVKNEKEAMEGSIIGTPFYMAPEIVNKNKYSFTVDVWGLGVSLYELLTLKRPFQGKTRRELYADIRNRNIVVEEVCSDETLARIINRCLMKKNRATSAELKMNDKIRLHMALIELKLKEMKIEELEKRLKWLEEGASWPPTPDKSRHQ